MPGLVSDAVRVAARVAQAETEAPGMLLKPGEGGGVFEALLGRRFAGRADVERTAAVVLGMAGRGVDPQHLVERQPARELPFEDAALVGVAAEA